MSILTDEAKQPMEQVSFVLKDEAGKIFGGVTERCILSSPYRFLWVDDSVRHDGYGSQLLHKIEDIAKEKGCRLVLLDSFSFQAPEFYKSTATENMVLLKIILKGIVNTFREEVIGIRMSGNHIIDSLES